MSYSGQSLSWGRGLEKGPSNEAWAPEERGKTSAGRQGAHEFCTFYKFLFLFSFYKRATAGTKRARLPGTEVKEGRGIGRPRAYLSPAGLASPRLLLGRLRELSDPKQTDDGKREAAKEARTEGHFRLRQA